MVFLAIKTLTRKKVKWKISKIIETFNLIVMKKMFAQWVSSFILLSQSKLQNILFCKF